MSKKIILASSSPRRQELLTQIEQPYTIRKPDVDESQIITHDPVEKVKQLAILKGRNVLLHHNDEIIISADTVVSYQNTIYEKPKSRKEAYEMMKNFSGDTHEVYTGIMLRSKDDEVVFVEKTEVEFWPLTEEELDWYVDTNDPYDKAGAYGIQSLGALFVKQITGDYYNVMGLPISRVIKEIRKF
ncbi:Maf family protein [Alkalibacillus silvisoli]|uniref:dTTP/UTP pyrophosphatase n=1 Tax=Alkalibacillus silvisoli TaxID=392823 RepID=A0ABN1A943_9BACI